jgi:hypothetical protein
MTEEKNPPKSPNDRKRRALSVAGKQIMEEESNMQRTIAWDEMKL